MNTFRIEFDDGVYVDAPGNTFAQAERRAQQQRLNAGYGYGDVTNAPLPAIAVVSAPARRESLVKRVFARFAV
jgi:hypothetical protein